ncbi:PhoX family phosphatase [Moraxella sp. FZFQ2102]|uniref:PhoX family protein n=1 Tax=Moraxella sp. FZFQ2102 TaxID=2953752 RepID=UPI00209BCEDA|nr:PhoX family phosphatase [Moraxella sp. FZFQ2102]USZ14665.1 PhoX family phosphatase [Moraxella sp. FZFQ2102]
MQHPHDYIEDSNTSDNPEFANLLDQAISRRTVLKGGAGLTAMAMFGALPMMGNGAFAKTTAGAMNLPRPQSLKFKAVPHYTGNEMMVAEGYTAKAFLHLGEPLVDGIEPFRDDRKHSGESFMYRMGDNHDGMNFYGMSNGKFDPHQSNRGLFAINHEYTNDNLHPMGMYTQEDTNAAAIYRKKRLAMDVRRDANAHGVSVVELVRKDNGQFELVKNSRFNKRYTSSTMTQLSGAASGASLVQTKYDKHGKTTWGINNECGAGASPWGTYLTTEENFLNVFARGEDKAVIGAQADLALARYGLKENSTGGGYLWHTADDKDGVVADEFSRWDITARGKTAHDDYRNGFNAFGYIVEIDPFNPQAKAIKRTSLGRFAHENCAFAPAVAGKPIVFYMGDDARGEYIYKFVSKALWSPKDIGKGLKAGDKYMNEGTLYVAVFNADGTGQWRPLTMNTVKHKEYNFANQADIVVHARLAADALGATKMDRPEWVAVSPITGEVYVTLTNNSKRTPDATDAANPRSYNDKGNQHGHIICWREKDGDHAATSFNWDVYLFAAPNDLTEQNLSGLSPDNDLSSPDGLYFDPRGVLWIQTDDGAYTKTTNCMLLAALPNRVGDGKIVSTTTGKNTPVGMMASDDTLKRFFVGPKGCEVTGITMTPDLKTLFINIQHPGEDHPDVAWGAVAGGKVPRSATVMITKDDGGVILGESL